MGVSVRPGRVIASDLDAPRLSLRPRRRFRHATASLLERGGLASNPAKEGCASCAPPDPQRSAPVRAGANGGAY